MERCTTLGHQLTDLVKDGFLKEYLEDSQEGPQGEVALREAVHETPIHGELNTIFGGFSGGRSSATKCKRYARAVISLETRRPDHTMEPALYFIGSDLEDVFSHENDPVVISFITMGRRVHKVLVNQGSSTDVTFWETFVNLQLSPD